ncbi:hypothetical protein T484DRAFT_1831508, partial [Baffinella frigidus]
VIILHSTVPREEQDVALSPALPGHCKVILSTNIAESSITIPDVSIVINSGLEKGASVRQRTGRAGRVAPGTMIHLYTKAFHDGAMPPFAAPEILRVPLDKTVLRVKLLLAQFGTPRQLLAKVLTPPPPERVVRAIRDLYEAGAIAADDEDSERVVRAIRDLYEAGAIAADDEDSEVTRLGRVTARLPVDLPAVRLILLGQSLECLPEAVVIAAALSLQDLWAMPNCMYEKDPAKLAASLAASTASRLKYDRGNTQGSHDRPSGFGVRVTGGAVPRRRDGVGMASVPLAAVALYRAWLASPRDARWAAQRSVSYLRIVQMDQTVANFCDKLLNGGLDDLGAQAHGALQHLYEAASKRKSRVKTPALEAPSQKIPLLSADPHRLRVILASAFSSFVAGISRNVHTKIPPEGFDARRCLTISEAAIENVFAAWNLKLSKCKAGGGGGGGGGAVIVEIAEDAGYEVQVPERLMDDHSANVKLVLQIFQDKRRKLEVKNPLFVPGGQEKQETLVIKGVAPFRPLAWKLAQNQSMTVNPDWRAAVGLSSDFDDRNLDPSGKNVQRVGTVTSLMLISEQAAIASGLTVFPRGNCASVLTLLNVARGRMLRLKTSEDYKEILGFSTTSAMESDDSQGRTDTVLFAPPLFPSHLILINKVRAAFSLSLSGATLDDPAFDPHGPRPHSTPVKVGELAAHLAPLLRSARPHSTPVEVGELAVHLAPLLRTPPDQVPRP